MLVSAVQAQPVLCLCLSFLPLLPEFWERGCDRHRRYYLGGLLAQKQGSAAFHVACRGDW